MRARRRGRRPAGARAARLVAQRVAGTAREITCGSIRDVVAATRAGRAERPVVWRCNTPRRALRCVANARFSVKERGRDKRAGGFAACGKEGDALPTSAWPCSAPRGQKQRGRDRRLNASASEAVRTICHVEKQRQQRHRPHGGRAHLGSAQPRRAPRRAPVSPSPTFSSSSTVWLNRMAFSASTVNWMGQVVSSSSPRSSAPELLRSV